ncbi:MAG: HD domain-containing protein, partial [Lachnospiraceae bacterium]|nr:HD domain-containing protein [Lachnospiraceae bacterium]
VGDPLQRFGEDALRIMRAVRFSAQLGYEIETKTLEAMRELSPNLVFVSAERIQTELVKLLVSPHPEKLRVAYETEITKVILPEFDACMETQQNNPHHCYSVGEHTLKAMQEIRKDKALRLAMLFHDIGKPQTLTVDTEGIVHFHGHPAVSEKMTREILKRLKFDNNTIYMVTSLVRYHDYDVEPEPKCVRRAIMKAGEDIFPLLFEVKQADMRAQSGYMRKEKEERLVSVRRVYEEIIAQGQCVSLKMLTLTGKDLIKEIGMQPGPEIGDMLKRLLDFVIEDPSRNEREILLKAAKEFQ